MKFKVILLSSEEEEEWLLALQKNPVFDFLNDAPEDIYTLKDGKDFNDKLSMVSVAFINNKQDFFFTLKN